MSKRYAFAIALAVAALTITHSAGCGDNRPKIRRPENPTPPPGANMRLSSDPAADPATKPPAPTQ
jgi:hypothetical protein